MSQLERLARPIPSGYIEQKPGSFAADYCAHHIITQILLKICGPFSFEVQQVFYNPDGLLDGCTASMTVEIDGRTVTVTEAGDCANAKDKKSQGERLENAASSALKRCAMRLGLGLHLWAQEDYFLYDQLHRQNAEAEQADGQRLPEPASQVASVSRREPNGTGASEDASEPASATSPPGVESARDTANGGAGSSPPPPAPPTSKARVQSLVARSTSLRADHVDVDAAQATWHLPDIDKSDENQLGLWSQMLADLEAGLTAPFEVPA